LRLLFDLKISQHVLSNVGNFNELLYLTSHNLMLFIIITIRKSNLIDGLFSILEGGALGKAKLLNGISFFCLASIALYASLILDIKEMTIKKITMATVAAIGIFRLYNICNASDNATYCVRTASFYRESEKFGTKQEIFYSNYPRHLLIVRPSSDGNIYIGNVMLISDVYISL
jgi:hypothetical protein